MDAPVRRLRTVPFIGLIALFIIWFGIGEVIATCRTPRRLGGA